MTQMTQKAGSMQKIMRIRLLGQGRSRDYDIRPALHKAVQETVSKGEIVFEIGVRDDERKGEGRSSTPIQGTTVFGGA